jgi:hypothetical protein
VDDDEEEEDEEDEEDDIYNSLLTTTTVHYLSKIVTLRLLRNRDLTDLSHEIAVGLFFSQFCRI